MYWFIYIHFFNLFTNIYVARAVLLATRKIVDKGIPFLALFLLPSLLSLLLIDFLDLDLFLLVGLEILYLFYFNIVDFFIPSKTSFYSL